MSSDRFPTRRAAVAGVAATGAAACSPTPTEAQTPPLVTVLGDSITSGYGLSTAEALPAQLQAALRRQGAAARVQGLARNGDTTADGLRKVEQVPAASRVVVVALGGNDLLRGIPLSQTRENLDRIVRRLQARGFRVVLAGMQAPLELGAFARSFGEVFAGVARERRVDAYYPFLLAGVALDPRYNQRDRIHPNAAGVRVIAERLAPVVAGVLRSRARAA